MIVLHNVSQEKCRCCWKEVLAWRCQDLIQHNGDFIPFYVSHKEPYSPVRELQGAPCRSAQGMWLSACPWGRCVRMSVHISPFLVNNFCFYEVFTVLTTHNYKIQKKIKMRRSVNYNRISTAIDKMSRNLKDSCVPGRGDLLAGHAKWKRTLRLTGSILLQRESLPPSF